MATKPSYTPRQIGGDNDKIPPIGAGKRQYSNEPWMLPDYSARRKGADDYMQMPSRWQGKTIPYRAGYTSSASNQKHAAPKQGKLEENAI